MINCNNCANSQNETETQVKIKKYYIENHYKTLGRLCAVTLVCNMLVNKFPMCEINT